MNKKIFWIGFAVIALLGTFATKAETTGDFQIVIDPVTHVITVTTSGATTTTGSISTGSVTTGATTTGATTTSTEILSTTTGTEFQQALAWMYSNGLTKYDNETEYRPEDGLLREEAAKIIGQAFTILGYSQTTKNTNCSFSDTDQIDPTLTSFVTNTCKRGIFKGTTDGKFLPREQLTRPQSMALLVRIFEGKTSNENRTPRWGDYYVKWQAMGLTTLNNQTAFDSQITRREMAIYIRRLRNIVNNETLKLMLLGQLSDLTSTTTDNSDIVETLSSLTNSLSISNDPELIEAIKWMNDNGLTSYNNVTSYQPFEVLNREQAAKILVEFAKVFNFWSITTTSSCDFSDLSQSDTSLTTYIQQVCQLGIMQGSNWIFSPKTTISKAQFISAMIRLFEGKKLDETKSPRWTQYFETAENMWIVSPSDSITFDNAITRYEVALSLYRFKVKYQITQNLNSETIDNQIISSVPGSLTTGTNNLPQSNVYVDMNLLNNGNFNIGYIEILGNRYKIVKSSTKEYFTNNFARYGDIFTLDTEEKVGTTSFIVSSLSLIEGTIRISDKTYMISPLSNTNAYYKLNQTK